MSPLTVGAITALVVVGFSGAAAVLGVGRPSRPAPPPLTAAERSTAAAASPVIASSPRRALASFPATDNLAPRPDLAPSVELLLAQLPSPQAPVAEGEPGEPDLGLLLDGPPNPDLVPAIFEEVRRQMKERGLHKEARELESAYALTVRQQDHQVSEINQPSRTSETERPQ